jgi:hypothetical protein
LQNQSAAYFYRHKELTRETETFIGLNLLNRADTIFWDVKLNITDVSDEHTASIFKVEKYSKKKHDKQKNRFAFR